MVVGQFGLPRDSIPANGALALLRLRMRNLVGKEQKKPCRTEITIVAATSEQTNGMFVSAAICPLLALLGPREMSDVSPHGGPQRTLLRPRNFMSTRCRRGF